MLYINDPGISWCIWQETGDGNKDSQDQQEEALYSPLKPFYDKES